VTPRHKSIFGQYPVAFIGDLHGAVAPIILGCDLRPHSIGMADDSSKVFNDNVDVKAFLDIEIVEVFPLECY